MDTNPFAHHTSLDELHRDWAARRAQLAPWWEHRQERARLATHMSNRADELRNLT